MTTAIHERKRAQKESLMYQELSKLFLSLTLDTPTLNPLSITRVSLSRDKGYVVVYFYCNGGLQEFESLRKELVLFKPSLRTAISRKIPGRYTPELRFAFDALFEKQQRIDDLIQKVSREEPAEEQSEDIS